MLPRLVLLVFSMVALAGPSFVRAQDAAAPALEESAASPIATAPEPDEATSRRLLPSSLTWRDLRAIDIREQTLWRKRDASSASGSTTTVIVGAPLSAVLLTFGGLMLHHGNKLYDDTDFGPTSDDGLRRRGAALMGLGVVAAGLVEIASLEVSNVRRHRLAIDRQLRTLGASRAELERKLARELASQRPAAPSPPAFQELSVLTERERALWRRRDQLSNRWGVAGIAVGAPTSLALLSIAATYLSNMEIYSGETGNQSLDVSETRRVGRATLVSGVIALSIAILGTTTLRRVRQERAAIDAELRTIRTARQHHERALAEAP